ncbi:superkiller complex protein 8-like [Liolophura sinensis]|uniref:superkiller complex protein 8-like n=1 Tax=Liolophura sinensis TaxID=3198878 RepID=UPI00315813BC
MWNDNTSKAHNLEVYFNSDSCFMTSVATSQNDGKQLVIGSNQGKMMMIDLENFAKNWRMAHREQKRVVVIRWCGNVFFSGTDDGHVYLHDPRASEPYVTQFRHHSYEIGSLQPSPDNSLLACGVRELGEVLIWDLRERKIFEQLSTHKSGNRNVLLV